MVAVTVMNAAGARLPEHPVYDTVISGGIPLVEHARLKAVPDPMLVSTKSCMRVAPWVMLSVRLAGVETTFAAVVTVNFSGIVSWLTA